ncbi:MAG: mannose-6-phosphate isomerase [Ruminococcaceae bacterium]|nr:mannose-6-phosphate isomerase [Oscillospiraceae bacterium]
MIQSKKIGRPCRVERLYPIKIKYGVSRAPWGEARYTEIGEDFPLLIKFIDAKEKLSVQVHPEGKTEMWYVIKAEEGAELILGLADGVTKDEFKKAVESGDPMPLLNRIKVHSGETYFIPAGLVHAIGGGILVAEIQQNLDITYRLYDYGRGRELHTEKAFCAMREFSEKDIEDMQFSRGKTDPECTVNCEYFSVFKIDLNGERKFCPESTFHSLLCIQGSADIVCNNEKYPLTAGDCYILPQGVDEYTLFGAAQILLSKIY